MEKFVIKTMINDVLESIKELTTKQSKYWQLSHYIVPDLDVAIKSLEVTLDRLQCDLLALESKD